MMDYEKQHQAVQKKIAGMKGKGGKSMDNMAMRAKEEKGMRQKREIMHRLVDEGMDMHERGDMDFKATVEDLHKSMMAMSKMKMEHEEE